jgi:chorismate mutase
VVKDDRGAMRPGAAGSPSGGSRGDGSQSVERAMRRLRENIDQVDSVLVKLLNQRAQWALEIGEVKRGADLPIYQPDREKAVLARVQELNRGPLGQAAVQRLFERIIDESRRLERIGGQSDGSLATPDGSGGAASDGARVEGGARSTPEGGA